MASQTRASPFRSARQARIRALAPLLCAGLIGWRAIKIALRSAGRIERLGLFGFGAAAHILAQVAIRQGQDVFAFTRPGDACGPGFRPQARRRLGGRLGRDPAGKTRRRHYFAPVGALVPSRSKAVRKGGAVVCAGIHMSDIPRFPYALLWEERQIVSVANLTRRDGVEFLRLAPQLGLRTTTKLIPGDANRALADLRAGAFEARPCSFHRRNTTRRPAIETKKFRVKADKKVDLKKWPTRIEPVYRVKGGVSGALADHVARLSDMQQKLYASNRQPCC